MLADLLFYGQFTSSNQGATSLTVTIDIYQITRSSGASSQVVTGGSCTPLALGVYYYRYAGGDTSLYDYIGVLKTTGTADLKQVPALWSDYNPALSKDSNGRVDVAKVAGTAQTAGDLAGTQAQVKAKTDLIPAAGPASAADYTTARAGKLDNLDAAVTSRSTLTAQQVWDVLTSGILSAGSIGEWILSKLNATVGSRAIPGDAMTLTAGERTAVANEVEAQIINDTDSEKVLQAIVDKIASANPSLEDLTLGAIAAAVRNEVERVGSPLLLTQTDVATLLTRITGPVLLAAGYTAPPTTGQIVTAINADATQTTARSNAATAATEAAAANTKAGAIQTILTGITSLRAWLRAMLRSDAPDATAAAEIGGTYNATTDSQQAIRDRGDAAWITGTGGGAGETVGANPVTLTVVDDDSGDPLPEALVSIRSAGGTLWGQERTDADGELATSLDDGEWAVSVNPLPGYNGVTGQAFTLPADAAVTVRLAPIAVGSAGSPNLCRVYGYLYLNGEAQEGQTVSAVLAGLPQVTSSVILSGERRSNTSDEAGYWYLDLVRGKTYTFTLEAAGITLRSATVPDVASVDFRTLIV